MLPAVAFPGDLVDVFPLGTGRLAVIASAGGLIARPEGHGLWPALIDALRDGAVIEGRTGRLLFRPTAGLRGRGRFRRARRIAAGCAHACAVVDERVLVKGYRRLVAGVAVEVEVGRWLTERARFRHAPAFLGAVVWRRGDEPDVPVAVAHEYVPGAGRLDELLNAAIGEDPPETLGTLGERLAALHAALAGLPAAGGAPRRARADEVATWRAAAEASLAIGAVPPQLADAASEALDPLTAARAPIVQRVHGDLHVRQILLTQDGPWFCDFEGEAERSPEERRAAMPALHDVATLAASVRGVVLAAGGAPAWASAATDRLFAGYRAGAARHGAPVEWDPDLVRALEVAHAAAGAARGEGHAALRAVLADGPVAGAAG